MGKQHKKGKGGSGGGRGGRGEGGMASVTDDPRFASMHTAPTFQRIPKDERRFKIDPRFKAVLTDDRFRAVDGQYDKYGRKLKKDRRVVDDLSAFYTVDDDEEGGAEAAEAGGGKAKGKKGKGGGAGDGDGDPRFRLKAGMGGPAEEDDEEEDSDDSGTDGGSEAGGGKEKPAESRSEMEERLEYLNRLARGEAGSDASVSTSSSSSSSGDSGSDGDEDLDSEGEGGEGGVAESRRLKAGPVPTGEATRRLAIMNVDWDHLKAVDLLGVLLSFKPAAGRVARVTVYCSDYGLERMAEEARLGPGFLRGGAPPAATTGGGSKEGGGEGGDEEEGSDASSSAASGGGSGDEGEEVDQEALRAYEIQRLRYYFAVAECDAVGTAAALYEEVDGLEFEASAAQLDARFVPDDVAFEGRPVRDTAEALPSDYEPPSFVTKALQQTSVECTWDLGDEERERKLTSYHKWHKMDDDDLGAYLASSSSESESEAEEERGGEEGKGKGGKGKGKGEERRKQLRSLLLGGLVGEEEEEEDGEGEEEAAAKEFTYVPGELGKQKWERRVQARAAEEEAAAAAEGETPFEAMLRKRREKRRARREARKNGEVEEGDGDEEDDFFAEGTEAAPAGAAGKGKKGTKQQEEGSDDEEEAGEQRKKDAELELLFAGEDQQERARDFDMRALARAERMKGKKLKGKRRRKEAERAGAAPGAEFSVDTRDPRFAALFDGSDARFGIDRTAKEYKATEGMKVILGEQAKRRRTGGGDKEKERDAVPPVEGAAVGREKGEMKKGGGEGGKKSLASLAKKFAKR